MARPVHSDGISQLSVALDENSLADPVENLNDLRFIISIDYGTTYTGVAWILTTGEEPSLAKINVVRNWGVKISEKVPSTLTYSPNKGEQWGHGIGDSAYVIQRTKLELEVPSREHALDCLRKTLLEDQLLEDFSAPNLLRNGIPFHLIKSPSDIVTDYLTHVAKCVRRDIESQKDKAHLKQFPIDYVITHPAEWDSRAKNLTFRSVKAAFDRVFREAAKKKSSVHLVTEPEACAQYTRRDAKEGTGVMSDLVPGDCFIVIDAGGGTVDLAAYQVEEAGENFQMSLATKVSGGRYGSTRIDDYFLKHFLSHKLPHEDLELIRGTGRENERHGSAAHVMLRRGEQFLLDQFIPLKHNFKGRDENGEPSATDWIDLPDGVGQLDDPDRNINQGQLGITCDDMERMFQLSVDGTIQLITHQLMQIHTGRLKVGAIFLSGGFSQSPYLFKRINSLAREYSITLLRGDDSWTAVAKGATLMALDMGCGRPPPPVMTSPCYVGVVLASSFAGFKHNLQQRYEDSFDSAIRAKNEIKWIVNKGDLVTQEEGVMKTIRTVRKLTPSGLKVGRVIIVTSQYEGRGEIPSNLDINNDPTRQQWNLDYDLAKIHKDSICPWSQDYKSMKRKGKSFTRVEMELDISVTQGLLNTAVAARAELLWGRSKDFTGGLGAPGVQLAWLDIPSP